MIFPPIFSLVLFFILDMLELVFDIFVVTSPVGVFMSVLSTILYIIILLFKYGPKKTKDRLFTFKKVPRLKVFKKIMKVFGASFIPFMTTWAVWDDYKEDLEEKKRLELGIEEEKKEGMSLKQKIAMGAAEAATGGAAAAALGARAASGAALGGEALTARAGASRLASAEAEAATGSLKRPWIKPRVSQIDRISSAENKTISEEVGGMKTGLSREDYDEGITDYSKPETYEKLIEEKRKEKEEKDRQAQKEARQKKIQGIKAEQDLRQELFDRSKRRYGQEAKETERLEDEYRESLGEEKIEI